MAVQGDWSNTDYYEVLGLTRNVSDEDIRRAYRRLARDVHPDTNPDAGAERRFKEVTAAYEVLGDADRRREYDEFRRLGPVDARRGFGSGPDGFRPGGTRVRVNRIDGDVSDLGDLFGDMFGSGGFAGSSGFGPYGPSRGRSSRNRSSRATRARRGADLSSTLSLPFLEAVHGTTTAINLVSDDPCSTCDGSGAAPGTTQATCPTCSGSGRISEPRTVKVRIPAGVEDGQTIRLARRGAPGIDGGPAGDLFLTVEVEPHPDFGRLGDNVTVTMPVTYPELVLGTDVTVPTIDAGTVTVRVPPGTPSGRTMRVKGRGIPGTGGDLLVTLDVVVPTNPTPHERELIEQLDAATSAHPQARWEATT